MTDKVLTRKPDGTPMRMPGWFSWRHETPEAHIAANIGRSRRDTRARKRAEAIERNSLTPHERRAAHRRGECGCEVSA